MTDIKKPRKKLEPPSTGYDAMLSGVAGLLEQARRTSARAVNSIMTAAYWEIGRRIVEFEQGGKGRAEYGKALLQNLSTDLTARVGRGFSVDNLETMRLFYQTYPSDSLLLAGNKSETLSRKLSLEDIAGKFPLPWSFYYLNYAREHWTYPDENPPVGLILCAEKDHALARYALEGLPNKVLAAEYKTVLPDEKSLVAEIDKTRKALEARRKGGGDGY